MKKITIWGLSIVLSLALVVGGFARVSSNASPSIVYAGYAPNLGGLGGTGWTISDASTVSFDNVTNQFTLSTTSFNRAFIQRNFVTSSNSIYRLSMDVRSNAVWHPSVDGVGVPSPIILTVGRGQYQEDAYCVASGGWQTLSVYFSRHMFMGNSHITNSVNARLEHGHLFSNTLALIMPSSSQTVSGTTEVRNIVLRQFAQTGTTTNWNIAGAIFTNIVSSHNGLPVISSIQTSDILPIMTRLERMRTALRFMSRGQMDVTLTIYVIQDPITRLEVGNIIGGGQVVLPCFANMYEIFQQRSDFAGYDYFMAVPPFMHAFGGAQPWGLYGFQNNYGNTPARPVHRGLTYWQPGWGDFRFNAHGIAWCLFTHVLIHEVLHGLEAQTRSMGFRAPDIDRASNYGVGNTVEQRIEFYYRMMNREVRNPNNTAEFIGVHQDAYRRHRWSSTSTILESLEYNPPQPVPLSAPAGVSFNSNSNVLSWNVVPNATGYHIYVAGTRRTIAPISGTSVNLLTLSLAVGAHNVQVRAVSTAPLLFDSALSTTLAVNISAAVTSTTLVAPGNLRINQTTRALTWNHVTGASGYHIYVNGVRRTTSPVIQTSFDLNSLNLPNGQYQIQVRAVNVYEDNVHASALSVQASFRVGASQGTVDAGQGTSSSTNNQTSTGSGRSNPVSLLAVIVIVVIAGASIVFFVLSGDAKRKD